MRSSINVKKIITETCILYFSLTSNVSKLFSKKCIAETPSDCVEMMFLFSCRESVPYSQEDDNASDDEAIWTKEVACGDGYYADTSDSEIVVGKAKSSDNILVSSSSDYDSGTGSRYVVIGM